MSVTNQPLISSQTIVNSGDKTVTNTPTLLAAKNLKRKEIEICLPSTAVDAIRVGNASVTTSSGSIIEPGTSKVFDSQAAWYAIRTGATDEIVTVIELARV